MRQKFLASFALIIILLASFIAGMLGGLFGDSLKARLGISKQASNESRRIELMNKDELTTEVVAQAKQAVVSVIISKDLPVYEKYFFNPFGNDSNGFFNFQIPSRRQIGQEERQVGAGSGFLVTSDGYIITNRHVVSDSEAEYTVILNDERKFKATVIARDNFLDIAVLKIDAKDLPFIELGDSDNLRVGQSVLAIGNTLGEFSNTVSSGIISGLYRSVLAGSEATGETESLLDLLQTDASISPGNSGGPLINLEGKAIGVNVAVSLEGENVGFAIPAKPVQKIIDSVIKNGKIVRPFLGVRYIQITQLLQEKNGLEYDYGALVVRGSSPEDIAVLPGSPADKAGIVENDIILEINGVKLDSKTSLQNEIQKFDVGDKVNLKIFSKSVEKSVTVTLEQSKGTQS